MKKRNSCKSAKSMFTIVVATYFLLLCSVFICGCKSSASAPLYSVNPIELLDKGATFYVSISPDADTELASRIISKYFDVSEGNLLQIVGRLTKVYAGFHYTKNFGRIQMAATGDMPGNTVQRMVFKSKNGWKDTSLSIESDVGKTKYSRYERSDSDMQISFVASDIACFAPNVLGMIERYDVLSHGGEIESGNIQFDESIKAWLSEESNEVRFFADNPMSFLTTLIGANLNLRLSYVKASMTQDPAIKDGYLLSLEFEFSNEKVVQAGQAMLSLAFGLANSNVERKTKTNLLITGIQIPKDRVYSLLSF